LGGPSLAFRWALEPSRDVEIKDGNLVSEITDVFEVGGQGSTEISDGFVGGCDLGRTMPAWDMVMNDVV